MQYGVNREVNAKEKMHPDTAGFLEKLLVMLSEKGEKETFAYVKREILKKKSC